MKKLFFAAMLLFSASFIQAQDSTNQALEVYKEMSKDLKSLAEELKVPAEHVLEVVIRQQLIDSITYLYVFIFSIIAFIVGYKLSNSLDFDELGVALMVLAGLLCIFMLCCTNVILTGFINPEYGAYKEIADMLKRD